MADEDSEDSEDTDKKGVSVVGATSRRRPGPTTRERARRRGRGRARRPPDDGSFEEPFAETAWDEDDDGPRGSAEPDHDTEGGWELRRAPTRRERMAERAGGARTATVLGLGALAIVATVAAITFGLSWSNANGQLNQQRAVKRAATTFLMDLTNFRPTTVDADFTALQNWAAPGSVFDKQAEQTFNSNIRQALIQAHATYQGQLQSIYLASVNGSSAQVYAVLDTNYQNSKVNSPVSDTLRVTVNLIDTSNGWRISAVTVQNPSGTSGTSGTTPSG